MNKEGRKRTTHEEFMKRVLKNNPGIDVLGTYTRKEDKNVDVSFVEMNGWLPLKTYPMVGDVLLVSHPGENESLNKS